MFFRTDYIILENHGYRWNLLYNILHQFWLDKICLPKEAYSLVMLCFVVKVFGVMFVSNIYWYISRLLYWHWGNLMSAS